MEEKLFDIESELTYEKYMWTVKNSAYLYDKKNYIAHLIIFICGLCIILIPGGMHVFWVLGIMLMMLPIILLFLAFVVYPKNIKKAHDILEQNGETVNSYEFYEDKVVRKNNTGTLVFNYDKIRYFREDDKQMALFIPVNKLVYIEKEKCSAESIEFLKSKITEENKKEYKKTINKQSAKLALGCVLIIAVTVFIIYSLKPINDYPYSTYESFVNCAEHGYVSEVTIIKNVAVYVYTGHDEPEYVNTVIEDKDALIEMLDRNEIPWSQK